MCELLGISSSVSGEAREVLDTFRRRGGGTADNPDGWGLAFRVDGALRLIKEPLAAARSDLLAALCESVRSDLILAHVRKARHPPVNTLPNTHPFKQVCCGREWVFAHNGLVPEIVEAERSSHNPVCRPGGETDSEHAFCRVLSVVAERFSDAAFGSAPSWFDAVAAAGESVARCGKFNFLMSDGDHLLAYGHDRLHYRETTEPSASTTEEPSDTVLVATEPLDAAPGWTPFQAGELRVYRRGRLVGQIVTRPTPEQR